MSRHQNIGIILICLAILMISGCTTLHINVPAVDSESIPTASNAKKIPLNVAVRIDEKETYRHFIKDPAPFLTVDREYTFPVGQIIEKTSLNVFSPFFSKVELIAGKARPEGIDAIIIPSFQKLKFKEQGGLIERNTLSVTLKVALLDSREIIMWEKMINSPEVVKKGFTVSVEDIGKGMTEAIIVALEEAAKEISGSPDVQALAYEKIGDMEFVISMWKKRIESDPQNAKNFIGLTSAYIKNNQYDDGITAAKRAIELKPANPPAYYYLSYAYRKKKQYNEAFSACKKAIEIDPANAHHRTQRGNLLRDKDDYAGAIEAYKKAVELEPSANNLFNLANSYRLMGKYDDAIASVNKAIELQSVTGSGSTMIIDKNAAFSFGLRSLIHRCKGNKEESFKDAEKAYALDSANTWARISLGAACLDRSKYEESIKLLIQVKDSLTARLYEATAYAKQGNMREAVNIYSSIPEEKISPKNIPLMNDRRALLQTFKPIVKEHRDKARSFESKGQFKRALTELSEGLKTSDEVEAREILEAIFSMIRRNPLLSEMPEDARKYAIRGETLIKEGNLEQAATEFKKGIQVAPYIAKLYYNTAYVNGELKKYPEAIRYMKIYVQADPDAPNSREAKDWIIRWEQMMEKGNNY
jgi:tetratricopeptide (TPR) repeat protein